ncbi:cupin domain-containing protein [Dyadobacter sp. CY345]|uniref:cupin domain-containing protein n=1 Tax=Dyadobacter sp. CY345 TaxID=2909335 RepID=UPI001F290A9D|nr:cupin domain-containing protein [Dyadobacter sp. CY345]MCF2444519.1 cupin domain-containing protein [Dyadobacter sp. CY345]
MSDIRANEFIVDSEIEWENLGGGLRRKVLSYDDNLMMVKVAFEKGGIGALHSHFHTQMSYIDSGVFEIVIGDQTQILRKGDGYYIPPDVIHGATCIEEGVLIDIFTPLREDFI